MSELQGKVAIVTGASSGIGRAAARLFAAHGARVVATARRGAALDALVAEIRAEGGEATALAGDIRDEALVRELVALAEARYGGLDVAFNNAGSYPGGAPVQEMSLPDWQEALEVNLTAAFLCARQQVPAMLRRGGGSIVFTSSIAGGSVGLPGMGAYSAAKAGLLGLMRVMASELGPHGIRANAIVSGGADTPMGRTAAPTPDAQAFVAGLHALKRIAAPEEIAEAALHLASDRSSFITGAAIHVDGGVSVCRT